MGGSDWKFQQDNASSHSSKTTKMFVNESGIVVVDWPHGQLVPLI